MLNEKKDTTICFTLTQGKYLLKQTYKVKECDTLRKICEEQRLECDSINKGNELIIKDYKGIMENQNGLLKLKQYEVDKLKVDLKLANKEVRKQKVYKWIAIGTTALATSYLGYYIVTHP
jgi:hypothetical protein